MNIKSGSAILFLYEGDTEGGFYDRLFELLNIGGNIQIKKRCLNGDFNLNKKVINQIYNYLNNAKNRHIKHLTVFVAYDREGDRSELTKLDKNLIIQTLDSIKLKAIHEIVATQMLESWFFIDMDGIYKFLKAKKSNRVPAKYAQYENFRHEDLNKLFQQHDPQKRYYKGQRTQNFIEHLDILKIYDECDDLHFGINKILELAGIPIPKRKKQILQRRIVRKKKA